MNKSSIMTNKSCTIEERLYTSDYLFFKYINATYLRLLIAPGILLNILCIIVLSRPKLSTKSTTILFLRYLALFDILAITLKYIRQEINYQSMTQMKFIPFLTPAFCQILYICMNTCISIAMWTIVLMSLDKAVAVSNPLKSSIWITYKRASYSFYAISLILLMANLSFMNLSGVRQAKNNQNFCGLLKDPLIVDVLTASLLPISVITAANVFIVIVLQRSSNFFVHESPAIVDPRLTASRPSQALLNSSKENESIQALKRRTSAQITRMLLAVTISLILFNIPNTIYLIYKTFNTAEAKVFPRPCEETTDEEIRWYRISFYISILQDILSDLPHIVNFFLYCLAGKKFRTILFDEIYLFLMKIHLIHRTEQRSLPRHSLSISGTANLPRLSHTRSSNINMSRMLN